jgi:hypothetical protein
VLSIVNEALTGSVKVPVAIWLPESVTVTEKETGPAEGGVPLRKPAEFSVNQEGNEEADQA